MSFILKPTPLFANEFKYMIILLSFLYLHSSKHAANDENAAASVSLLAVGKVCFFRHSNRRSRKQQASVPLARLPYRNTSFSKWLMELQSRPAGSGQNWRHLIMVERTPWKTLIVDSRDKRSNNPFRNSLSTDNFRKDIQVVLPNGP